MKNQNLPTSFSNFLIYLTNLIPANILAMWWIVVEIMVSVYTCKGIIHAKVYVFKTQNGGNEVRIVWSQQLDYSSV